MAKKSLKNCKHVVDLIHACTPDALQLLGEATPFEALRDLNWDQAGPELREHAIAVMTDLPSDRLGRLDQEAVRILQVSGWHSEDLVRFGVNQPPFLANEGADFDPKADGLSRLIWFFVRLPAVFDQMETVFLAYHFHGHKKFKPFRIRDGQNRPFVWTDTIAETLQTRVSELLTPEAGSEDNCEVIHFEMDEAGTGSGAAPKRLHYVVVYHPGKMKVLRQMKDRRRDLLAFYPALEATLVYDPAENRIMVLADQMPTRIALAECFAQVGFDQPLSAEPLEQVAYDLTAFRSPVDLLSLRLDGAVIEQAWVAGMTVALGHTRHKLTVVMQHDDNVWDVLDEQFGTPNPLERARFLYEVRLSFVIRFDGESLSKPLDFAVTYTTCSLLSLPDRALRDCGEQILMALGVTQPVQSEGETEDVAGVRAELALLDEPGDAIGGFRLRQMGLVPQDLETRGVIRKKALSAMITRCLDDEEGLVYQRLEVQSNSRQTWALDPVTGAQIDLAAADLQGYGLNRAWVMERLMARVAPHLTGLPLEKGGKEPHFLGFYPFGDQAIPVHLVTRLWQDKHAEAMDLAIRKENSGLGVVLTTTGRRCRSFLGSSLVMPLTFLIQEGPNGAELDLRRIEPEVRRWRGLAATANEPRLIRESGGAVLVGPWPDPWFIAKPEQIASVDVLVKAWQSGKRKCTKEQVLADFAGARNVPERFRDDPRWKTYIRPGDRLDRPRLWELNIGQPDGDSVGEVKLS
jgi:hypothetical protein